MVNEANIRRFVTNLFAYPAGYFEQHTPEELHITEEERQELIRRHAEAAGRKTDERRNDSRIKEFEAEFFA